jgi:hypothetical protein
LRRREWEASSSAEIPAELEPEAQARIEAHKWDPPHYEIALNLGYSNYRNQDLEAAFITLASSTPCDPSTQCKPAYLIGMADEVDDGWAAGFSLTLNSWNWVSNELSYMRQQTKFLLVGYEIVTLPNLSLDAAPVGWVTRRFAYNTVFNLRPRRSRWRPYVTAGPAFQLLALANAPLKQPSGYFRLGLSNIGLIKAAIDFGGTPPLNGGGVYQFGLQYGGGFKYRITPRLTMRADFGETWSANPEVIKKSYTGYLPTGLDNTYTTYVTYEASPGKYIQQRSTVGFAFTF